MTWIRNCWPPALLSTASLTKLLLLFLSIFCFHREIDPFSLCNLRDCGSITITAIIILTITIANKTQFALFFCLSYWSLCVCSQCLPSLLETWGFSTPPPPRCLWNGTPPLAPSRTIGSLTSLSLEASLLWWVHCLFYDIQYNDSKKDRNRYKHNGVISMLTTPSCDWQSVELRLILSCKQLSLSMISLSYPIMILLPVTNNTVNLQDVPDRCFWSIPQSLLLLLPQYVWKALPCLWLVADIKNKHVFTKMKWSDEIKQ